MGSGELCRVLFRYWRCLSVYSLVETAGAFYAGVRASMAWRKENGLAARRPIKQESGKSVEADGKTHPLSPRGSDPAQTLAETVAARIREQVISGRLTPGSHLSEQMVSDELQVSRNTLREVFRMLTKEGLLRYEANRGVFVSTPSMSTIIDIYRVRRFIECPAVAQAHPRHPAVARMRSAVEEARRCRQEQDWLGVGSADIAFHAAIVELSDSPRMATFYTQIALELRLVFGLLKDPEFLHGPFIDQNLEIVAALEAGNAAGAAQMLEAYLVRAERFILGAYARVSSGG
ncbi:GntR family transcriptional regulator [Neorhizobium sp. NPDC001467]|uniref:GntR family transcriptional regulator n=1 Tax=Neorhizobium sp. NPDC001467 TaxID=3390595 RepID=UPI003CFF649C